MYIKLSEMKKEMKSVPKLFKCK